MRLLKVVLRRVYDLGMLSFGWLFYQLSGRSLPIAYRALIGAFCATGGVSNDVLSRIQGVLDRPKPLPEPNGELGVSGKREAERIAERIRSDGFFIFEQRLSPAMCDRLLAFSLQTPASVRRMSGGKRAVREQAVYERDAPIGIRYDFKTDDILAQPDVQDLLASTTLLSVAQQYLGTTPIADVVGMWWHTGFSHEPDEEAAQFFHFDMDRIKWLKFFIYLTDVGPENGPHCFVKGSHRTGGIPPQLLSKGYSRLTDEQVLQHYSRERIVEFVAERGMVLAEDTRGLHKGREVLNGDRLMLQLQFSNSLFGGFYPSAKFPSLGPGLARMSAQYPRIYKNYLEPSRA